MPGCPLSSAGVPLPTLRWYKDAVRISPPQHPRYRVLPGGGLRVQKLRPDDSGVFQCFASNAGGEVQTSTYLDVTSEYRPSERLELPDLCPGTHSGSGPICSAP